MIDVHRPAESPASLARGKSYKDKDVLEALHDAFLGKCYLCETEIEVGTFEVDHRKPRGDARFSHLEFTWMNLYPACKMHSCNQRGDGRVAQPFGFALTDPGVRLSRTRLLPRIDRVSHGEPSGGG
jgi:hypothetical protein